MKTDATWDTFLSHDWRTKGNHAKVMRIANELHKKHCISSWIDAEHLRGGVLARRIIRGIDQSRVFVCFLTESYCEKVAAENKDNDRAFGDWCFVEFHGALNLKTTKYMLPVVMEKSLLDTTKWQSPLIRGVLSGKTYVDMTSITAASIDVLAKRIHAILHNKIAKSPPEKTCATPAKKAKTQKKKSRGSRTKRTARSKP